MQICYIDLNKITPAAYNPREISDTQFQKLKQSITELGFIIPILVNRKNNVIIAGHQRTKAGLAVGETQAPVFYINDISLGDEIKFNQIHNGVDKKELIYPKITKKLDSYGFQEINHECINVSGTGEANYVKEMCRLILKYGNVLCAVACDGEIILHTNYIRACKALNIPANIYNLEPEKKETALKYFKEDYGKYSYKHLKKETYVQGLAQMHRLSDDKSKKQNASCLYETVVIPYVNSHDVKSILDFGCGKGAYIELLKKKFDAHGLEFYNNNGNAINVSKGNKQIDDIIDFVKNKGRFDFVVCDSVLNSVDSMEAEKSVMSCLSLFSKDMVAFSGRTYSSAVGRANLTKSKDNMKYVVYMDDEKFTGDYRKGKWYYQHFHDDKDVKQICERYGFELIKYTKNSTSWQCLCRKKKELDKQQYIDAICFEFNLPLPNSKSYNRHMDMLNALKQSAIL